jgi:hypothetical protein
MEFALLLKLHEHGPASMDSSFLWVIFTCSFVVFTFLNEAIIMFRSGCRISFERIVLYNWFSHESWGEDNIPLVWLLNFQTVETLAFVVKMRCMSPWTGLQFLFFEDDVFHLPYWTNLWDVMDSWQGPEGTGGGKQELDKMKTELQSIGAVVNLVKRRSIISLICNVKRSSLILEKVKQCVLYSYWFVVMGTWSDVAGL